MAKLSTLPPRPTPAGSGSGLHSISEILDELRAGRMVVIMDDEDRENEGDLLMAAECVQARGHQLHGALRPRPDLPDAHARALRAAAPAADGQRDRPAAAHQFHGLDRGGRRASPPASRRTIAPTRCAPRCARTPSPRTCASPGMCFRSWRSRAACSRAPGTPRRAAIWRGWPASSRQRSSSRS